MKTILLLFFIINWASANDELILNDTKDYNPSLTNRFSFQADTNPNPRQLAQLTNLNFSYASKLSHYWLDFNLQSATGYFNKMTTNNALATGQTDNQLYQTNSTHYSIGVGMMMESHYARTLMPFDNVYETTSAYITYNMFKINSLTDSYQGPGIMAKASLCKRYTDYVSLGINLNYVLAVVKGPAAYSGETSSSRSLTLSYVTVGLDFILTL